MSTDENNGPAHVSLQTSAVTRTLDDLHLPTWFAMQSVTISLRSLVMHPLSLAASRKRVSDDPTVSIKQILHTTFASTNENVTKKTGLARVRNLYRGFGTAVVGNIIGEISCLWTVEAVKQEVLRSQGQDPHDDSKRVALYAPAIGGACGDLVAVALTTPLCIVCDRQLTSRYGLAKHTPYESAWQTARRIWRGSSMAEGKVKKVPLREGLSNFYAGAPASLAMMPAAGVWWSCYTEAKFQFYKAFGPVIANLRAKLDEGSSHKHRSHHKGPLALADENWLLSATDNPLINGLAGIVASTVTSLLFTPLAVIRTRLQTVPAVGLPSHRWRITQVTVSLYRVEGVKGFYRGALVNVGMAVLDGLAFSTLYEINKLGSDQSLAS